MKLGRCVVWTTLQVEFEYSVSAQGFVLLRQQSAGNCGIAGVTQEQPESMILVASCNYGRPLSVSGRPCYILPMFFFIFLWPPYSPALVNGGSRKFYTWWTLSVIEEVSSWIFSWSPLNYRVGQKVAKFGVFSDRTRKLSALTPERGRIL